MTKSAIISHCGKYRYRLDRTVSDSGPVYAFFGVNPSTADASVDDATVRKWRGFVQRWGGSRFIVGNVFAYRATDVNELATAVDPFGDLIGDHTTEIINEADVLVPCWGNADKVPPRLQFAFDVLMDALVSSGKPVKHFGVTATGHPKHLRDRIWATYRPGQEITKTPSPAYLEAAREVQAWIKERAAKGEPS